MSEPEAESVRADIWLWRARFYKTRTLAASAVKAGAVRLNGDRFDKPSKTVRPGDVLTATLGHSARVARIIALGVRRGPAEEARALYEDLTPPPPPRAESSPPSPDIGGARPTKRDRRALDRLREGNDGL